VVGDLPPATSWARKLDWEQVVVDSLEVLTDGVDFVDQVFDALDAVGAHGLFNDSVVGDLDSLSVNFDGASFVDHVFDGGLGWVSPGDEWITAATGQKVHGIGTERSIQARTAPRKNLGENSE